MGGVIIVSNFELNHADLDRWITRENPAYADPGDYNFDGEDPAPTALLECPKCRATITFYGDFDADTHNPLTITLDEYELYQCECGAVYHEGAELTIVDEDASQCSGFGCVDGCSDCDPRARELPMDGCDFHVFGEC